MNIFENAARKNLKFMNTAYGDPLDIPKLLTLPRSVKGDRGLSLNNLKRVTIEALNVEKGKASTSGYQAPFSGQYVDNDLRLEIINHIIKEQ